MAGRVPIGASTTVVYRPFMALTYYILWLSSTHSAKCAISIHYATVVLGAQAGWGEKHQACLVHYAALSGYAAHPLPVGLDGGDRCRGIGIITTTDGRRRLLFLPDKRRISWRLICLKFGYQVHFRRLRLALPTISCSRATDHASPAITCGFWLI